MTAIIPSPDAPLPELTLSELTLSRLTLPETIRLARQAGADVFLIEGLPPDSPLRPYRVLGRMIIVPTGPDSDGGSPPTADVLS